ncbi:MAG: hypothetical protein JOS17DRAFT_815456 [Linnemannia elongata]|nr:MAG: hypothetical protein JOS17DRAFT_815456 [Linnemannia elongata]
MPQDSRLTMKTLLALVSWPSSRDSSADRRTLFLILFSSSMIRRWRLTGLAKTTAIVIPKDFDDIAANSHTLWRASIPDDNQSSAITIDALDDKTELDKPRTLLSQLFPESPDDNTYTFVRPPQVHAPAPSRAVTPHSGSLSDGSRPSDIRSDIKKIANRFFETGSPASDFLDAYVRGEKVLPVTTAGVKGLPKVLR